MLLVWDFGIGFAERFGAVFEKAEIYLKWKQIKLNQHQIIRLEEDAARHEGE